MSATHLAIVESGPHTEATGEPLSQRIRRLQAEARALARDHVDILRETLVEVSRLAAEIADGGEAYPVGARELSRRLMDEANFQSLTLGAITER
jgi:hypothetical protein